MNTINKISLILSLFILLGCVKEVSDLSNIKGVKFDGLDGEYAIPIAKSSVSLNDLMSNRNEKKFLVKNSEGFLSARFDTVSYSLDVASLIKVPDITQSIPNQTITIPSTFAAAPDGTQFSVLNNSEINETFNNTENFEFDEITFEEGTLEVEVTNTSSHPTDFTLLFPDLKSESNVNLIITKTVSNGTDLVSANLRNFTWDFTNSNTTFNNLKVRISAVLKKNGNNTTPADFGFTFKIKNVKYKKIKGFFGDNRTFSPIVASLPIDFFKQNNVKGNITLRNPIIQLNLANDFRLPIRVELKNNQFKTTYNDNTTQNITGLPFPIVLEAAPNDNTPFLATQTSNNITPNMGEIVRNNPVKLEFELNSFLNPNGKTSQRNIIRNTDKISVSTVMELPLELKADGFELEQRIEAKISDISNADSIIDKVEMKLILASTLPIDDIIQIEVIDPVSGASLKSLLPPNTLVLKGAVNGVAQTSTTIIPVSGSDWKNWAAKGVKELRIVHKLSTSGGGTDMVKIFEENKVDVLLGAKVYLKAKF